MKDVKTLNYIILKPRQNITLNLFESEKYESAVIVQQLVGTLVYYSNFGRYEPRLAQSWEKLNDSSWSFKLKKNLKCENGEVITPSLFKKSIERSLLILEKQGAVPILSSLKGYKNFLSKNLNIKDVNEIGNLDGIHATDEDIIFSFEKKIKSGLLQILSFTPFGYICSKNFNKNGEWLDEKIFISSGPYKVIKIDIGNIYELEKNPNWNDFNEKSANKIIFSHKNLNSKNELPTILDAFTGEYETKELNSYPLVPEYLNSVLLGNLEKGFFSKKENRKFFKKKFNYFAKSILPEKFGINTRSSTFYPNQQQSIIDDKISENSRKPLKPLVIEGKIPTEGTARWYSWKLLEHTLNSLKFPYKFAGNESSFFEITNRLYDIRIRGSSIGGGVEAWGLFVSFCSSVGINFPDPDKKICKLIEDYEEGLIDEDQLSKNFFFLIEDEAALLPVSHYGVNLFISDEINSIDFSPLAAILKLDQIGIGK